MQLSTHAEFDEILAAYRAWRAQFLDNNQQLLPQYEPRPLGPATERTSAVKVPAGPNELW